MKLTYQIKETDLKKNINQILKTELNISTILLKKLIKNKQSTLNQYECDSRITPCLGDTIEINLAYPENNSNIIPIKMPLNIIYEDEWFMVVNKPAGMPIHPSRLHYTESLSNGIKYYFNQIRISQKNPSRQSFRF